MRKHNFRVQPVNETLLQACEAGELAGGIFSGIFHSFDLLTYLDR
ncbi:hypothetical protein COLO4_35522 [Corchorus olitorius]|uniref:Uncharacterized protein n=1 Tax=Corchorus olitorius TaxID=93759 RepID=A0A1R3GFY7_9ROSI|nr:hypothetical protein COLO4_35522 [Corchorus olitorius]